MISIHFDKYVYQSYFSSPLGLGYLWHFPPHYWNILQYFMNTEAKFSIWSRGIIPHLCLLVLEMPFQVCAITFTAQSRFIKTTPQSTIVKNL